MPFRKAGFEVCVLLLVIASLASTVAMGQAANRNAKTVEITPANPDLSVGQKLKFTAVSRDASGKITNQQSTSWFAVPFDLAKAGEDGTVSFFAPGEVTVGAVVGGTPVFIKVTVKPAPVAHIEIEPLQSPLVAGDVTKLEATARTSAGDPRRDVTISWMSENTRVAKVDAAGVVTGLAPGKATLHATSGTGTGVVVIDVVKGNVTGLAITPGTAVGRTGDVIHFDAGRKRGAAGNYNVRWAVGGEGATIDPDGAFVAELPGTYIVTASSGAHEATASVVVTPRNVERTWK